MVRRREDFAFDAFISYSGSRGKTGEKERFDRKIAERLRKDLEAYRAPRSLAKKSDGDAPRRLKKIFRDVDELRASSSLSDSLTEALRKSRFLIVICSPRARDSKWVNREIEIFRDLGGGAYILPVLIEGEPAESFPPALLNRNTTSGSSETNDPTTSEFFSQPLAADFRDATASGRKIEKLRLLATILGCEFDDLKQRDHERSVKRVTIAGAALLALVVILTVLSVRLYIAEQRARRNAELALEASAEILPLVALPEDILKLNDPLTKEIHLNNAIRYLETLRADDPNNLHCLITLRAVYGALMSVLKQQKKGQEAESAFQKSQAMVIPIALSRLRSWKPSAAKALKSLSPDSLNFPKDHELKRLHNLMSLWEQLEGPPRLKDALLYIDYAAEYLTLLDTSTEQGKAEAKRVLLWSLNMFAKTPEPLTDEHKNLVSAIKEALNQLTGE